MKNMVSALALLLSGALQAQYYYNDIMGTREINAKMKNFLAARVQSVSATGYDPQGRKASDFNETQEVLSDGKTLRISTRNGQTIARTYYQFDDKTRLIIARDSSGDFQMTTSYVYDHDNNLVNIKSTTRDAQHDFDQTKERQYRYVDGQPSLLLLIQNGTDSLEYRFSLDEHKNVKDEMLYHRGSDNNPLYYSYNDHKVYYFYDDQNRLTDITRYNKKIDRLLPDFMFEYDDDNRVIQRITVLSTIAYDTKRPDYLIWRYAYDDKNLKLKDVMYSKAKELKGSIQYSYSFAP